MLEQVKRPIVSQCSSLMEKKKLCLQLLSLNRDVPGPRVWPESRVTSDVAAEGGRR